MTFAVTQGQIKEHYAPGGAYQAVHTAEETLDFRLGDLVPAVKEYLAPDDLSAVANLAALLVAIDATVTGALKTYLDAVIAAQMPIMFSGRDGFAGTMSFVIAILIMSGYYLNIT
jgi:hypothetical protein